MKREMVAKPLKYLLDARSDAKAHTDLVQFKTIKDHR